MTAAIALSPRVHWIGALDPELRTFDIILKTAQGTTYNAYVVRGQEGVAIIDTVKAECAAEFFARLESVARYDEIKLIVLNHLEPDHTGALPELLKRAPQAHIYVSQQGQKLFQALLKQECTVHAVTTGDQVSLGDCQLTFLQTPYLHWPDTQCTYLEAEQILFSGDVFGCHFCDPALFDDQVGDFQMPFEEYYAHIMRPFKRYVLEALALIEPLTLRMIAPTHGPVLRQQPQHYIECYRHWSTAPVKAHKTILIFYLSAYGNTAKMAAQIHQGAQTQPGVQSSLLDLLGCDHDKMVDLIEQADALVLGAPTINGDAPKPIWDLLSSLALIHLKGKLGAAFGSYGWTGEAVSLIEARLRGLKLRVPVSGLRVQLIPTTEELAACHQWGQQLAQTVQGVQQVIDMADLV
ncbi:MAG: FprA family A-type flavoprotein [Pseudomonadota bacterium]|nr:FprA family A-type flavoprotein [Pseudomonadota bacterium]